jgi:hypothetical protein
MPAFTLESKRRLLPKNGGRHTLPNTQRPRAPRASTGARQWWVRRLRMTTVSHCSAARGPNKAEWSSVIFLRFRSATTVNAAWRIRRRYHLLKLPLQLRRRVRHARPNRTLSTSASTPPLNGYELTPGNSGRFGVRHVGIEQTFLTFGCCPFSLRVIARPAVTQFVHASTLPRLCRSRRLIRANACRK